MTRQLILSAILLAGGILVGFFLGGRSGWLKPPVAAVAAKDAHQGHDHDHDADHDAHESDPNQLVLSDQARQNLGLKFGPVTISDFWRTIVVPGIVSEQPGNSERRITTAVNGIITKVYVSPGQTVRPGDALVDIQTTGELLANAQASLLKTIQDLELVNLELKRLEPLVEQGSIPGTRVLEKQYERQRLETQRLVQVQELLVRGLGPEQVSNIMETRVLLRTFTIRVPRTDGNPSSLDSSQILPSLSAVPSTVTETENNKQTNTTLVMHEQPAAPAELNSLPSAAFSDVVYSVEDLEVFPGKLLQSGDELCGLALHTDLRIVGMAFQKEAELINLAIEQQRPVIAIFESQAGEPMVRENLTIQYVDNVVDPTTRLLRFFLPLKNEVVRDLTNQNSVTFRAWRFKPGQRVQLRVPVEHWTGKIVLPIAAVVKAGAETYVFRENGKLLERVSVSVLYEDTRSAVLADDGSLFEGDPVAMNEAYQLNLALMKAQGSGVDLHAGHNH